jgi:hypothetical protein
LCIRRTIRRVEYNPMDGGRRYSFQPPNVSGQSAHMAHYTSAVYTTA